jgi:hypothetical protein
MGSAVRFGQGWGTGRDTDRYWHHPRFHILPISADHGEDVPARKSPMDDWQQSLSVIVIKQYVFLAGSRPTLTS